MTEETMEKFNYAVDQMQCVTYDIRSRARAFSLVGNQEMADRLFACAETLGRVYSDLHLFFQKVAAQSLYAAQQGSVNVLNAALAGAELARRGGAHEVN